MTRYTVTVTIEGIEAESEADACEIAAEDLAEDTGRIVLFATAAPQVCDACDAGARVADETSDLSGDEADDRAWYAVERCDACGVFDTDEEAARAVAQRSGTAARSDVERRTVWLVLL